MPRSSVRLLCIHAHFYQPPRENPWLEAVQVQDSAYPYHDWNARITEECYAPNARSRILGPDGFIERIVNNYARISFNVGPTLLSWLETEEPEVYRSILEADRASASRFGGHGSAMAQGYHHAILPLCNERDRRTQVRWGVRDFEHRFGRRPEGMWLPETAVCVDTLEALAAEGILFTVLEPHQAKRWRPRRGTQWREVSDVGIDPTRPYLCALPSGRTIALFFYDGPISRAVAFERLLSNGEMFARRLTGTFHDGRDWNQIVHIATDGETYGHHHRHGDMALAYALETIEAQKLAVLTNYAAYLAEYPPACEVEIAANTSWSCAHGVERWRSDCGCNTGGHPGWNQAFRAPLRESLDWLRDALSSAYEREAGTLFRDPWGARDAYVDLVLERSLERRAEFFRREALRPLSGEEQVRALECLELQRHALMMYTSCGWFFNDLGGIETVQVLQYAARAIQLGEKLFGLSLEEPFLARLEKAKSNVPEIGDGRNVWARSVKPAVVGLKEVAAHFAVTSLFEDVGSTGLVYCYEVSRKEARVAHAGRARLATGMMRVTSRITGEQEDVSYAVLHFGDHNLTAGVRTLGSEETYRTMLAEVEEPFLRAELPEVLRRIDRHFHGSLYSLRSLFRDEQRRIVGLILENLIEDATSEYRALYDRHGALMRYLADLEQPLPRAFLASAEVVINSGLRSALSSDLPDVEKAAALLAECDRLKVELDAAGLARIVEQSMGRLMRLFSAVPEDLRLLEHLEAVMRFVSHLPFPVDLWDVQNTFYALAERVRPAWRAAADAGDHDAMLRWEVFRAVARALKVRV